MEATGHLLLLLLLVSTLSHALSHRGGAAELKVPAIYVFGDSTADVGNNNYLPGMSSKANFPHYGVDFPTSRSTGRFSNGYNGVDFLAIHMGFRRSPPPYLSLGSKPNHQIWRGLRGVNFASGGSGVSDLTGNTISMREQIQQFSTIRSNITARMASRAADTLLSKSIFLISTGGNDIFSYFSQNKFPNGTEKEQVVASLILQYSEHLTELYNLGARKVGIVDVPPIGCCPYPRSLHPTGGCIDVLNDMASRFNDATKVLLQNLSLKLKGLKYSIGSSNAIVQNIMRNPDALGFKEVKTACCGSGKFNGESGCTPNATYCSNRNQYLFWDMLHPTHATSKLAGVAIYKGSLQFAYPINFKQLVED